MSVCLSVDPICAVYENHYLSASFTQPIKSQFLLKGHHGNLIGIGILFQIDKTTFICIQRTN